MLAAWEQDLPEPTHADPIYDSCQQGLSKSSRADGVGSGAYSNISAHKKYESIRSSVRVNQSCLSISFVSGIFSAALSVFSIALSWSCC